MTRLARETGLNCEPLYKSLSREGNPSFETIIKNRERPRPEDGCGSPTLLEFCSRVALSCAVIARMHEVPSKICGKACMTILSYSLRYNSFVVIVHPRVCQRHPELTPQDVTWAWEHFLYAAVRIPGERELRTGFDQRGRGMEMVGVLTENGWLVYHAMIPPSKKTRLEIERALRRK